MHAAMTDRYGQMAEAVDSIFAAEVTASGSHPPASCDQLLTQLAECQADKDFVWSLWRELQSSAPDKTRLISLVVTREKEKADRLVRKLTETNQDCNAQLADMVQTAAVQKQEIEASLARESELKSKFLGLQRQLTRAISDVEQHTAVNKDQLLTQLREEKSQNKALRKQLVETTAHLESLAAQVQQHAETEQLRSAELEQRRHSTQQMTAQLRDAMQAHATIQNSFEQAVSKATAQVEASQAESQKAKEQLAEEVGSREAVQMQLGSANAEVLELRRVLQSAAVSHNKERTQLQEAITKLGYRLTREQKHKQQLHNRLSLVQQQVDELQKKQAGLQQRKALGKETAEQLAICRSDIPSSPTTTNTHAGSNPQPMAHEPVSTVSVTTQTDAEQQSAGEAGDLCKGDELAALRAAHGRRLQRFQHLQEAHHLLQEQLRTFEVRSSPASTDLTSGKWQQTADTPDPWYLQQEDLHGPAPWNELSLARKAGAGLQKQLDIAEEERDLLMTSNARLKVELSEQKMSSSQFMQSVSTTQNKGNALEVEFPTPLSHDHASSDGKGASKACGMTRGAMLHDASTCTALCGQDAEQLFVSAQCTQELRLTVESQQEQLQKSGRELQNEQGRVTRLMTRMAKLQAKLFAVERATRLETKLRRPPRRRRLKQCEHAGGKYRTVQRRAVSLSPARRVDDHSDGHMIHSECCDSTRRLSRACRGNASSCIHSQTLSQSHSMGDLKECCGNGHDCGMEDRQPNKHSMENGGHVRCKSLSAIERVTDYRQCPHCCGSYGAGKQRTRTRPRTSSEGEIATVVHLEATASQPPPSRSTLVAFGKHFELPVDTPHVAHSRPARRKRSKSVSAATKPSAARHAVLCREVRVLRTDSSFLRQRAQQAEQQVADLQRSIQACQAKLAVSQSTVKHLQDEHTQLVSHRSANVASPPPLSQKYPTAPDDFREMEKRIAVLSSRLKEKTDREKSLVTDVARQLATLRRLRQDGEESADELARVKARCAALERDLRQKQTLVKSVRDGQASVRQQSHQAALQLGAVEGKLKSQSEELASQRRKIAALQRSIATDRKEKELLQGQLQCSVQELAAKRSELQCWKDRVKEEKEVAVESEEALSSLLKKSMYAEEDYRRSLRTMQQSVQLSKSQLDDYKQMVQVVLKSGSTPTNTPEKHEPRTAKERSSPPALASGSAVTRLSLGCTEQQQASGSEKMSATSSGSDFALLPVAAISDDSKTRSSAWLRACQLSCSILELSASELSDLMDDSPHPV